MLSATSRKYLRGPRGMGFLYVRQAVLEALEPPFLDLHAATWVAPDRYVLDPTAKRFENWESNIAAKLGLGAAVDYALGWGLEDIWARIKGLSRQLRQGLAELSGVELCDLGVEPCGIVSFRLEGHSSDSVRDELLQQRINVNVSRTPSTLLDMTRRSISDLVRASVHYYNSEEEIERLLQSLFKLSGSARVH